LLQQELNKMSNRGKWNNVVRYAYLTKQSEELGLSLYM
jgi:hypothetical protein